MRDTIGDLDLLAAASDSGPSNAAWMVPTVAGTSVRRSVTITARSAGGGGREYRVRSAFAGEGASPFRISLMAA
jgi:hypothetical protein